MAFKRSLVLAPLFLLCTSYVQPLASLPAPHKAPAKAPAPPENPNAHSNPSVRAGPPYEPHRWNIDSVRMKNNCYAYAANDIDTREYGAMPGHRTLGQAFFTTRVSYDTYKSALIRGAVADGMIHTGTRPGTRPGYYRVVLVMSPPFARRDTYWHWLRQDRDGTWSGKDGSGPATNLDNASRPITDPDLAWFGGRTRPVAYFLAPQGGLDVGNPDERKTHPGTRTALSL